MKIGPQADFPIRVIPEADEQEGPDLHHFEGIYRAILNHFVSVVFVPDVSSSAPPWDDSRLPSGVELAENQEQARIIAALLASYVVTPNDSLAGTTDRITWSPDGEEPGDGVVFYTTGEEFAQFERELTELSEILYRRFPEKAASTLRDYAVVRFLEEKVADSGLLRPHDAEMLGRR